MFKEYYECHITFNYPKGERITIPGWKFSQIDGDPVLGDGVKSYLTSFMGTHHSLLYVIDQVTHYSNMLKYQGIEVLRSKVERVVYDTKSAANLEIV